MKANNLASYQTPVDEKDGWGAKTILRKYGFAGLGKYYFLKAIIAGEEDCTLDLTNEDLRMSVSTDLDFEPEEFDGFVDVLVNKCKLLKLDNGKLTGEDLLYTLAVVNEGKGKERKRKQEYRDKIKILSQKTNDLSRGTTTQTQETNDLSNGKTGVSGEEEKGTEGNEKEEKKSEEVEEAKCATSTPAIVEFITVEDWEKWCNGYAPNILQMKEQMNFIQLSGLVKKYSSDVLKRIAHQMNNKLDLLTKYSAVFSTIKLFIENEKHRPVADNNEPPRLDLSIFSSDEVFVETLDREQQSICYEHGLRNSSRISMRTLNIWIENNKNELAS